MKAILVSAAVSFAISMAGIAVNYKLIVEPAKAERESQKAALYALLAGDRAEAAVQLTGRANARFTVIANQLGEK